MKIGVDIRPLQTDHRYRGIGSYVRNLVVVLAADSANQYVFYQFGDSQPLAELKLPANFKYQTVNLPRRPYQHLLYNLKNCLHQSLRLDRGQIDVFLATDLEAGLPKADVPVVGVAYDLIPRLFPDRSLPHSPKALAAKILRGWQYRLYLGQLRRAKGLIAISNATKQDLVDQLGIGPDKISVVPLAYDPEFRPLKSAAVLGKFGITKPYLMYAGGSEPRKNVLALVNAFEQLTDLDLQLVLAGYDFDLNRPAINPPLMAAIAASPRRADIILAGFVPNQDLIALYSQVKVFVFPSLYEGFGIPVLEAMACGAPVVAYRNSSIPEVAGEAAKILDPNASLADATRQVATDAELRQDLIAKGTRRAAKFSWSQTAQQTIKILEAATRAHRG